ncbi:MAG: tRNA (N6-threonylcarbamoyladenosine(37)-N6)-methyltransferase TrmO [Proteobacteria bacterium]|nr:tRNA (N6-threonylcarbamoyladenosine(37)-N6)-methyltransferase TrmO [Pseudomonadota bacterium]
MIETIHLKPIGYVVSPMVETVDEKWGGVVSKVLLLPEYAGGLDGLDGFSHAIVVTYLNKAKYESARHLKRRPRGLESMPLLGIFSQRAKDRPNPIGITAVRIIRIGTDHLEVQGLDAINGTPVLDIKPYYPLCDRVENPRTPEWVAELMKDYF